MSGIDSTHDPALRSWVESAAGHGEFPFRTCRLGSSRERARSRGPASRSATESSTCPPSRTSCRARSSRHSQAIGSTTCSRSRLQHAPACAAHYHRSSATERIDRRSSRICTTYRSARCICRRRSVITRISMSAFITRPTSVVSSGPTIRCCRTTSTSRSGTTAAAPRCGHREPKFAGRTVRSSPRSTAQLRAHASLGL